MIFNRASRDLDVIEWNSIIGELLIILVPLARDQHNVSRPSERNRAIDCLRAIDYCYVSIRVKAFLDFGYDCAWIFFARIIRSDDGIVSEAICHGGH